MKRGIILILLILVCLPLVTAETFDMNSFEEMPSQTVVLRETDSLRFQMFDQTHVMIIDDISEVSVGIKFFLNEEKFGYTGMTKGQMARLDINKDAVTDLRIYIMRIEKNEEGNNIVTLIIESVADLEKSEGNTPTGSATEVPTEQGVVKKSNKNTLAVIGVVVLGLVLFLFMRKKEDVPESFEEDKSDSEEEVEIKAEDITVEDTE